MGAFLSSHGGLSAPPSAPSEEEWLGSELERLCDDDFLSYKFARHASSLAEPLQRALRSLVEGVKGERHKANKTAGFRLEDEEDRRKKLHRLTREIRSLVLSESYAFGENVERRLLVLASVHNALQKRRKASQVEHAKLQSLSDLRPAPNPLPRIAESGIIGGIRLILSLFRAVGKIDPDLAVDLLSFVREQLSALEPLSLFAGAGLPAAHLVQIGLDCLKGYFLTLVQENPSSNSAAEALCLLVGMALNKGSMLDLVDVIKMLMSGIEGNMTDQLQDLEVSSFLENFAPLSCELPLCCVGETDIFRQIPWTPPDTRIGTGASPLSSTTVASMTADGEFLFVHGPFGLCKIGTGLHESSAGEVLVHNPSAFPGEESFLGAFGRHLLLRTPDCTPAVFVVYDMETLQEVGRVSRDGSGSFPSSDNRLHPLLSTTISVNNHSSPAESSSPKEGSRMIPFCTDGKRLWQVDCKEPSDSSVQPQVILHEFEGSAFKICRSFPLKGRRGGCPKAGERSSLYLESGGFLSLGNPSALNFEGKCTLEAWVRLDEDLSPGISNIIAHGDPIAPFPQVFLRIHDSRFEVGSCLEKCYGPSAPISARDMGRWIHLAGVYDGSNWHLYKNGDRVGSSGCRHGALLCDQKWSIGSTGSGDGRFFTGAIDEVRIWSCARSGTEIKECMHHNLQGDEPHLKCLLPLNEGNGRMAFDLASNLTGVLSGEDLWQRGGAPIGSKDDEAASITYLPCRLPNEVHELLSWYSNGKSLGVVIPAHLTKDLVPAELGPCHLVQVYSLQDGCLLREHTLPVTTSSQAPSDAYRCVAFEQLNNLVWAWTPSSPESFQGWENLGFSSFEDVPDIDDEFPLNAETIVSSPFFKTSPKLSNLVSIQRVLLWLLAALDLSTSKLPDKPDKKSLQSPFSIELSENTFPRLFSLMQELAHLFLHSDPQTDRREMLIRIYAIFVLLKVLGANLQQLINASVEPAECGFGTDSSDESSLRMQFMVLLQNLVDETPSHSLACSAQETIRQEVCNVLTYGLDIFVPSIRHQAELLFQPLASGEVFHSSRQTVLEALMRKFSTIEAAFDLMSCPSFGFPAVDTPQASNPQKPLLESRVDLLCVLVTVVRREETDVFRALHEGESALPSPTITLLGVLQKAFFSELTRYHLHGEAADSIEVPAPGPGLDELQNYSLFFLQQSLECLNAVSNLLQEHPPCDLIVDSLKRASLLSQLPFVITFLLEFVKSYSSLAFSLAGPLLETLRTLDTMNKSIDAVCKADKEYLQLVARGIPVLQEEVVESKHPYRNNTETTTVVSFPGAKSLKLMFDPQCSMEKDLDFLEVFSGVSCGSGTLIGRYSGRKNSEESNFPSESITVPSDSVVFHFRSDYSETDWGYCVTVKATFDQLPVHTSWLLNLEMTVANLVGTIFSHLLMGFPVTESEEASQNWLESELFCEGLEQRFLSPEDVSDISPLLERDEASLVVLDWNDAADKLLEEIVEGKGSGATLVDKLREAVPLDAGLQHMAKGNEHVERAVRAVTAVLLKHNVLVDEASVFTASSQTAEVSESLQRVWRTANRVRRLIAQRRQIASEEVEMNLTDTEVSPTAAASSSAAVVPRSARSTNTYEMICGEIVEKCIFMLRLAHSLHGPSFTPSSYSTSLSQNVGGNPFVASTPLSSPSKVQGNEFTAATAAPENSAASVSSRSAMGGSAAEVASVQNTTISFNTLRRWRSIVMGGGGQEEGEDRFGILWRVINKFLDQQEILPMDLCAQLMLRRRRALARCAAFFNLSSLLRDLQLSSVRLDLLMCLLPYTGMRDFKDTEISCERHAHFGADIQGCGEGVFGLVKKSFHSLYSELASLCCPSSGDISPLKMGSIPLQTLLILDLWNFKMSPLDIDFVLRSSIIQSVERIISIGKNDPTRKMHKCTVAAMALMQSILTSFLTNEVTGRTSSSEEMESGDSSWNEQSQYLRKVFFPLFETYRLQLLKSFRGEYLVEKDHRDKILRETQCFELLHPIMSAASHSDCKVILCASEWISLLVDIACHGSVRLRRTSFRVLQEMLFQVSPEEVESSVNLTKIGPLAGSLSSPAWNDHLLPMKYPGQGTVVFWLMSIGKILLNGSLAIFENDCFPSQVGRSVFLHMSSIDNGYDAFSVALELIGFVRKLLGIPKWKDLLLEVMGSALHRAPDCVARLPSFPDFELESQTGTLNPDHALWNTLCVAIASLAIMGGHYDGFRTGASVRNLHQDSEWSTILSYHPSNTTMQFVRESSQSDIEHAQALMMIPMLQVDISSLPEAWFSDCLQSLSYFLHLSAENKSVSFPDIVRMRFSLYTVRLVNNLAKNRPSLLTPVLEAHLFPLLVQSAIIPTRQDSASVTLDMEEMGARLHERAVDVALGEKLGVHVIFRNEVPRIIIESPKYMSGFLNVEMLDSAGVVQGDIRAELVYRMFGDPLVPKEVHKKIVLLDGGDGPKIADKVIEFQEAGCCAVVLAPISVEVWMAEPNARNVRIPVAVADVEIMGKLRKMYDVKSPTSLEDLKTRLQTQELQASLGFKYSWCSRALAQHNGDLNAAAEWLFENAERLAHEDAASGETTAAQDCEVASVIDSATSVVAGGSSAASSSLSVPSASAPDMLLDSEVAEPLNLSDTFQFEYGDGCVFYTYLQFKDERPSTSAVIGRSGKNYFLECQKMKQGRMAEEVVEKDRSLAVQYARRAFLNILSSWPSQLVVSPSIIGEESAFLRAFRVNATMETMDCSDLLINKISSTIDTILEGPSGSLVVDILRKECLCHLTHCPSSPPVLVFETSHPYVVMEHTIEISIPKARGLYISFDPHCETSSGNDFLRFSDNEACTDPFRTFSGPPKCFKPFFVQSNRIWMSFKAENSHSLWGYRVYAEGIACGPRTDREALEQPNLEYAVHLLSLLLKRAGSSHPDIADRDLVYAVIRAIPCATGEIKVTLVERLTQLMRLMNKHHEEAIDRSVLERIISLVSERYHLEKEHAHVVFSKYMQALCDLLLSVIRSLRSRSSVQQHDGFPIDWRTIARVELEYGKGRCGVSAGSLQNSLLESGLVVENSDSGSTLIKCTEAGLHTALSSVQLTSGKWYFEVELRSASGIVELGWVTSAFHPDPHRSRGVGGDQFSWGFDPYSGFSWHSCGRGSHASQCAGFGDIVGCCLDMDQRILKWTVNGKDCGTFYFFDKGLIMHAAVSIMGPGSLLVNLGQSPLRHIPAGYLPLEIPNLPCAGGLEWYHRLADLADLSQILCTGKPIFAWLLEKAVLGEAFSHNPRPVLCRAVATSGGNDSTLSHIVDLSTNKYVTSRARNADVLIQCTDETPYWLCELFVDCRRCGDSCPRSILVFASEEEHNALPPLAPLDAITSSEELNSAMSCEGFSSSACPEGWDLLGMLRLQPDSTEEDEVLKFPPKLYKSLVLRLVEPIHPTMEAMSVKQVVPRGIPHHNYMGQYVGTPEEAARLSEVRDELVAGGQNAECWTKQVDGDLVQLLQLRCEREGMALEKMDMATFCLHEEDFIMFPFLKNIPIVQVRGRLSILKYLNTLAAPAIPLIDMEKINEPGSLAFWVASVRHLILLDRKRDLWTEALLATEKSSKQPSVSVNRARAMRHRSDPSTDPLGRRSLFGQIFRQARDGDFRSRRRAWEVKFEGEGSEDAGGPYRESISEACADLQTPRVCPLLLLCPNGVSEIGECRDKFILNPASTRPVHLSMYHFLGKLMGIALRTGNTLNLDLASTVWKPLVNQDVSLDDIVAIDHSTGMLIRKVLEGSCLVKEEIVEGMIGASFTTILPGGLEVELKENGRNIPITLENIDEYVALLLEARLSESHQQIAKIKEGLESVVPAQFLGLFDWRDLEVLVCGRPVLDVTDLRKRTVYRSGLSAEHPTVEYFWKALESFTPAERSRFLRFVWGRSRAPVSEAEWADTNFRLCGKNCNKPDDFLPVAHTCFFSMDLPFYTSYESCRQKVLYAAMNCTAIDIDHGAARGAWAEEDEPPGGTEEFFV